MTNGFLNTANIIRVFLISAIGPYTRNATKELCENVLEKEDAINASASEQSDRTNANHIMTSEEDTSFCPISNKVDVLINVCIEAAINAPIIKYLPTEKNSSTACFNVPSNFL